jgi:membrane fusion protein, heavy metal efflux system
MNDQSRVVLRLPVVVAATIGLLGLGAGGTYLVMRSRGFSSRGAAVTSATPQSAVPPSGSSSAPAVATGDVVISLTDDAIKRAGIDLATVTAGTASGTVRIPGTVEPNAYKQVAVTSVVSGRVTRVLVELGDAVRRGQPLAQIFSPDLAVVETQYLSMKAELEAHERELDRTRKLVEIGAASQQELERLHAEHTAKVTSVQSLRSRLVLLGMTTSAIDGLAPGRPVEATTEIPAPIAGVVIERTANNGLNVETSTKLFTVADLSTVWIVGALYERDFANVRVGTPATVKTAAYSDLALPGRISYIDPEVSADTRTARVRVEVPNSRQELRLGMFAEIEIVTNSAQPVALLPRSAVQTVGERQVVYVEVEGQAEKFLEREVHLGQVSGNQIEVVAGAKPGDRVVASGSFFIRAERARLGLPAPSSSPRAAVPGSTNTSDLGAEQVAEITVGEEGFEPPSVTLRAGTPARLTFTRTTGKTCATAVVLPTLNIRRDLPLNRPVDIKFTPSKTGEIQFMCGMNMLSGAIVIR